jgi:competence protein ComEA
MKKEVLILFLFVIILSNVYALCKNDQIDINSASAEELDKLSGIGPVKAQAIIDFRPFNSLSELINVNGIGEITLFNIQQQGLACVSEEVEEKEEEEEEENTKIEEKINKKLVSVPANETPKIIKEEIKPLTLTPNAQSIKSENSKQLDKSKLPIYGIVTLCLLLVTLFLLKKDRYKKNEFR